jgi:hypothetical protein
MEEMLGLERFALVQDNIRIAEQQDTQKLVTQAQEAVAGDIASRQQIDDDEAAEAGLDVQ